MAECIRNFKLRDFPKLASIIGKEWNLGKKQSEAKGNICSWIYAFDVASCATETFTYDKNDEIVGFISYTAYPFRRGLKQSIYLMLFKMLFKSPSIKYPDKLREYYNYYDYIPENMKIKHNSSLNIFIVDEKFKGKGYGRELFDFLVNKLNEKGFDNLLIETDDSCSVDFYIRNGCIKIKDIGSFSEQGNNYNDEKSYIYEKRLK